MDIDVFPAAEMRQVFQTIRTALNPRDLPNREEQLFLSTLARITGHPLADMDLATIEPDRVEIAGPHQRKRLLQLCAMAALLGRPVKQDSVAFVKALSRHLAVHDPVIQVLDGLLKQHHVSVRLLAMRRAFGGILKDAYRREGAFGIARFLTAMILRRAVNKDRAWQYKRLGLLPEGTLGRAYWSHMTRVGFGFPGEPGGIPDSVAYHDVGHVLANHETTPLGEIQQACFQAGSRRRDGFFFVQFVILQFHHGVKITPATDAHVGHFDPELALWALHRGASLPFDMTDRWDFWPLMTLTLHQARDRCGLLPKLPLRTSHTSNRTRTAELNSDLQESLA